MVYGDVCHLILKPKKAFHLEPFSPDHPPVLSSFVVTDNGHVIGFGKVLQVAYKDSLPQFYQGTTYS
jgi:translation elongation factor EF-1alpha